MDGMMMKYMPFRFLSIQTRHSHIMEARMLVNFQSVTTQKKTVDMHLNTAKQGGIMRFGGKTQQALSILTRKVTRA